MADATEFAPTVKWDWMSIESQDDIERALNALGHHIVAINTANGWNVPNPADWDADLRVPTLLALIHSEVSEALEAFRKRDYDNFKEELADVLIRLIDTSHGMGIDMHEEVMKKLHRNRQRGFRHGGKKV